MRRHVIDRLALAVAAIVFCAAIVVLYREFAGIDPQDVITRLAALPTHRLYGAVALTVVNYLLLTGYDFLALRYVRRRLRLRDVLFASFTAFAFSNGIGLQLISGGSTRFRLYSGFGLGAVEIGEIVAFCALAYVLGIVTTGGLLALTDGAEFASLLALSRPVIYAVGIGLLVCDCAYLAAAARGRWPIRIGNYRLRPPSMILGLAQIALACVDTALAGAVLYTLLPADVAISYPAFLCIYLIAATASVLSFVPGGLGVLETAVTLMVGPSSKAALAGTFIVYRLIYFVLPLAIALSFFVLHEVRRHPRLS